MEFSGYCWAAGAAGAAAGLAGAAPISVACTGMPGWIFCRPSTAAPPPTPTW